MGWIDGRIDTKVNVNEYTFSYSSKVALSMKGKEKNNF